MIKLIQLCIKISDCPYFEQIVCPAYPAELQLYRANSVTEAPVLGLNKSLSNSIVSSKFYEKII